MKRILSILLAFAVCLTASVAWADDEKGQPFNGLILDSTLKPIKRVRVYVKDRQRYATSDKQGRFGLTDVAPTDTITLEIKKEKYRIPVEGRKSMKIIFGTPLNVSQDDELVDAGYGYVKRREYTGVSSGISGDQIRRTGQQNLLDALSGLVPGLTINVIGGQRVANIRGMRSLLLSNEPLYMVDGVQVDNLDMVSVYDVDHVEVLKSASQYGMKGANGAILVTTLSAGRKK
ncbi:MAG: TonB-dependent receptor plug domain-containing protein [Muribaculaceae bacterium]|nr:TonB-dependent receptor plug domain-containing protein [Muribaculaceae bacterium]